MPTVSIPQNLQVKEFRFTFDTDSKHSVNG